MQATDASDEAWLPERPGPGVDRWWTTPLQEVDRRGICCVSEVGNRPHMGGISSNDSGEFTDFGAQHERHMCTTHRSRCTVVPSVGTTRCVRGG